MQQQSRSDALAVQLEAAQAFGALGSQSESWKLRTEMVPPTGVR
jgi:hypothetical protein